MKALQRLHKVHLAQALPLEGGGVLSGAGILRGRALHGRRRLLKKQRSGGAHERAPLPHEASLAKIDRDPAVDTAAEILRRSTFAFCATAIVGLGDVVSFFNAFWCIALQYYYNESIDTGDDLAKADDGR